MLFTVTTTNKFYSLAPLSKSSLKLVCSVNIIYRNLTSANSQDYAQKPQRNCTFMNSASGKDNLEIMLKSWILETKFKCKYLYIDLTVNAYIIFCDNIQTVCSYYNEYKRSPVLYVLFSHVSCVKAPLNKYDSHVQYIQQTNKYIKMRNPTPYPPMVDGRGRGANWIIPDLCEIFSSIQSGGNQRWYTEKSVH